LEEALCLQQKERITNFIVIRAIDGKAITICREKRGKCSVRRSGLANANGSAKVLRRIFSSNSKSSACSTSFAPRCDFPALAARGQNAWAATSCLQQLQSESYKVRRGVLEHGLTSRFTSSKDRQSPRAVFSSGCLWQRSSPRGRAGSKWVFPSH